MYRKIALVIVTLFLLGAACQKPVTTQTINSNTSSTFTSGIYYRLPNTSDPSAILSRIGSPLGFSAQMSPVDFDISASKAVYADDDTLYIVSPDGRTSPVTVTGLYQMARPTLSHDGSRVAVQATRTAHAAGDAADPSELKIFVVDLADGSWEQISPDGTVPNESPTWFNQSNRLAYSSFSPTAGVDIHIYDLDKQREVLTIEDAGWHGLAVSKDDGRLLVPNSLKIYDTITGQQIADVNDSLSLGLLGLGYQVVADAGDADSPFLDGDFSPDDKELVVDVAILRQGETRSLIVTINLQTNFVKVAAGPLSVNPAFSNNFNFSQVNPLWL